MENISSVRNINLDGNHPCSSCGLCVAACPVRAIGWNHNDEGFYRPAIDIGKCTDCGTCLKVCYKFLEAGPVFENTFKNKPVYAAWSKNEKTLSSCTSGGIGYELASHYHRKGYSVCGVVFDEASETCKHIIANGLEDLEAIKGSKYLQSDTTLAFSSFKKDEKYVVIGTPCQIYGLRKFIRLKNWEENFILIDLFCHGTPSYNLWKKYKEYICAKERLDKDLSEVRFRSKKLSTWHTSAMSIVDKNRKEYLCADGARNDLFFKFFLNDSCLNDSCGRCQLRLDNCSSDIRIADFWGKKYRDNTAGVTLVVINTEKGKSAWVEMDGLEAEECKFEDLELSQPVRFNKQNRKRKKILAELCGDKPLDAIYHRYFRKTLVRKWLSFVKRLVSIPLCILRKL